MFRALAVPIFVLTVFAFVATHGAHAQTGVDKGCSPTLADDCSGRSGSPGGTRTAPVGSDPLTAIACALFPFPGCPSKPDNSAELANEINERGLDAFRRGDYAEAARYFRSALKYRPDNSVYKGNLADAEAHLAAQLEQQKRAREAELRAKKAANEEILKKNKTAAGDMRNKATDFANGLQNPPTKGDLEFETSTGGVQPAGGALDFVPNTDTSVVDLRDLTLRETQTFYALQTRTFEALNDGGHPIDSKLYGSHILFGGMTWMYGFKTPIGPCNTECRSRINTELKQQLRDFCDKAADPRKCFSDGIPFTPDDYDLVVSMARSHSALVDLLGRVTFDNATLGAFTAKNPELFKDVQGKHFDTMDCHSNGAMLCLAGLRGKVMTADTVRLFGPQITPEAAAIWRDLANDKQHPIKIEIYINNGDPVPAAAWKAPKVTTDPNQEIGDAWIQNGGDVLRGVPEVLRNVLEDSASQKMDSELAAYGLKVVRSKCSASIPSFGCHSMRLYEDNLKLNQETTPASRPK